MMTERFSGVWKAARVESRNQGGDDDRLEDRRTWRLVCVWGF